MCEEGRRNNSKRSKKKKKISSLGMNLAEVEVRQLEQQTVRLAD